MHRILQSVPHVAVVALSAVVMWWVPRWVEGHPVVERLDDMRQRVAQMERETEALRWENQQLWRQLQAFSSDALTLEQRARDEFFFVYPDEIVLDLSSWTAPGPAEASDEAPSTPDP